MYKLVNNLAPDYLCSLIPPGPDTNDLRYDTRQRFDLPLVRACTELLYKSFFPSVVRLWNELPINVRHAESFREFKSKLIKPIVRPFKFPELLNFGRRYLSILHTRLRLGSSQLKSHLFKIGVKDSPECLCGTGHEDTWHFFFACPFYVVPRSKLHSTICDIAPFSLQTVLYGSADCSMIENTQIFSAVHDYISLTERFKSTGIG